MFKQLVFPSAFFLFCLFWIDRFSFFLLSFSNSSPASLLLAVLEVYVLSTDGQVQDFKFPQIGKSGISIQLSANTVKLNSRNGELKKQR